MNNDATNENDKKPESAKKPEKPEEIAKKPESFSDRVSQRLAETADHLPAIGSALLALLPKIGRMFDHASVLVAKVAEQYGKPIELVLKLDEKSSKEVCDNLGEMMLLVLEGAVVKVETQREAPATPVKIQEPSLSIVSSADKMQTPTTPEKVHLVVVPDIPDEQVVEKAAEPVLSVDLSLLVPKEECSECMTRRLLCNAHAMNPEVVEAAQLQMVSFLDDLDDGVKREPWKTHFRTLKFQTKTEKGGECDRDCLACSRQSATGRPRPVSCLQDMAKLTAV